MKILSLFDGMSVAQRALKELGVNVDTYYASEIDEYAMAVTQSNFPKTSQLGGVEKITNENSNLSILLRNEHIDLLIGGSPCQNLSIAGNKKGLDGTESKLFFEYVRIRDEVKPQYFILENVASMTKENKDKMSAVLGIQPIMIDSKLLSAQDRKRLFWVGKWNGEKYEQVEISQPTGVHLVLQDIWTGGIDITARFVAKKAGTLSYKKAFGNVRTLEQKSKTLMCGGQSISNSGATNVKIGERYYALTPTECLRLQSMPDDYFDKAEYKNKPISNTQRYKMCGNAFNCEVVKHIIKQLLCN